MPAAAFLAAFFVYPLIDIALRSFPDASVSFYRRIFTSNLYLRVIGETFRTAGLVTVICLLLAYPYAYAMAHARRYVLVVLAIALLLPFWVSLLLRSFSWLILLQDTGVINRVLMSLGVIDAPLRLIRTQVGVVIGMVHILLPYAVLPIYAVMRRIDNRLMEASAICGAGRARGFVRVYFPLSLPGVGAAALLTFTLSLGFYITPAMLGGPRDTMIAQLIAVQVSEQLNFGMGSALAVVLLLLTGAAFGLFGAVTRIGARARRGRMAA
ncbi:MAG: ABC transporter permease [Rhodospirillaceae bacterium]|nr:ABC transporter permease [Rhodospirillaceae bacterium]